MEEIKETVIENPYGFIYITTNLINGKRYLGQKSFDHGDNWRTYLGSGKIFKEALEKYGVENFVRNIICFCFSEEELNKAEYELSVFLNVVEDTNWYNLCYGGGAPRGFHVPDEQRRKMSLDRKGTNVGVDNPYFGKHHPEEVKQRLREFHSNRTKELQDKINKGHMKSVVQYDFELNAVATYESIKQASETTKIVYSSIQRCCKKERPSAGGFIWRYSNEPLSEDELIQIKDQIKNRYKKNQRKSNSMIKESGRYESWMGDNRKYRLRFVINKTSTYLGTFSTKEEVQDAINNHKNNIKDLKEK